MARSICVSIHLYEENIENSVSQDVLKTSGWNLQCMIRVPNIFGLVITNILSPRVFCPCPWAIYMHKMWSLNVFFSETDWPIFTRFHIGLSVEGVLSICLNSSALSNKVSTMPLYGKKKQLQMNFSRTKKTSKLNLGIHHWGLTRRSTKLIQMMILCWSVTFLWQGQICIPILLYGGKCCKIIFLKNVLRPLAETYNVWSK